MTYISWWARSFSMPMYGGEDDPRWQKTATGTRDRIAFAFGEIYELFLERMGDCFDDNEGFHSRSEVYTRTLSLYKHRRTFGRWLYLRKEVVYRNILRISILSEGVSKQIRNGAPGLPSRGPIPVVYTTEIRRWLKCELYLQFPRLLEIVKPILDALSLEIGYNQVEYVDASDDDAAWYPDERPQIPKAKISNA